MRSLLTLLALMPAFAFAQVSTLQQALAKTILAPNQPLIEVQVYTAAHVKSMPPAETPAHWDKLAASLRSRILNEVVLRGEAKQWSEAKTKVEWLDALPGPGYRVRKLR